MNEHELQSQIIAWARSMQFQWPCLRWLHSNLNGAPFSGGPRTAAKLKASGLVPGICDLFLPFAEHGYHGFYIEMKRPGAIGQVRDGQKEFMEYLGTVGYLAQVIDSFDGAVDALEWYLSTGVVPTENTTLDGAQVVEPTSGYRVTTDGFGNTWPPCTKCGSRLQVMRPGDARCPKCDG